MNNIATQIISFTSPARITSAKSIKMKNLWLVCFVSVAFCLLFTACNEDNFSPEELDEIVEQHVHNRTCQSAHILERQLLENPEMHEKRDQIEQRAQLFETDDALRSVNTVYTIPVVVHVVYKTSAQNISEAQIQSQIDVLNDDFRRLNSDANNNWSQAADTQIEFCLATTDPNGNPTTGITRTSTTKSSFNPDLDQMKKTSQGGIDPWNANEYLNIWVCNISDGVLGYAQFPGGNLATDGVVVGYQYFGTIGTASAPFNLGRTGTHEVGHYLNLYHIWGDGPCGQDDMVTDTPASDDANYGCSSNHSSCGSLDMVQNYMDYSDDACMNLFTTGQKNRMRSVLAAGGSRSGLINSNACGSSGGGPTCSDGVQNGDETGIDCGGSNCAPCGCTFPSNIQVDLGTDPNQVTVSWNPVSGVSQYQVRYRRSLTSAWTNITITGTSKIITNLTQNKVYDLRIRSKCADGSWSSMSAIQKFRTVICEAPTNLNAVQLNSNKVRVEWSAYSHASKYQIFYRIEGSDNNWSRKVTYNPDMNFRVLSNLIPYESYEFKVRSWCEDSYGPFSSESYFTNITQ